jgi:hypothetical protein
MANRCRLPDMQICITATLEQELHLRFNEQSRRWRGQTDLAQRRAGRQESDTSKCESSHQWTSASRTAWQSVDVGVVMGKTMRGGSALLLACPSRGRPGARARTSFLFFSLDNSISVHMHITMPKRKRDGSEASASDAEGVDGAVSTRQHRVQHKLDYAHKQLARAFKAAKGLEAQKSGRRRKTAGAKSDGKEVARIEAETAALKVGRS